MPGLKEVRNRIASVTSTRQITSAMKLVSASKLKKAQDNILKMRPYAQKLGEILANLSQDRDVFQESPYSAVRPPERILIVAFSSNKGLCGAYNANIVKRVMALVQEKYSDQNSRGQVDILAIGRKAAGLLSRRGLRVTETFDHLVDKPTFAHTLPIVEKVMEDFRQGRYDEVVVVYNEFRTAASQNVQVETFLPLNPDRFVMQGSTGATLRVEYIFQPSKDHILLNVIPTALKTQFFRYLLDAQASEHGSRMTAMHKATDNAGELLRELRLSYNKARQASITKEILEIVAGAEALKG
ncbi:MAG: ATP synthase F1 subunit gamma [Flavobacteriales bacterium]|nr:ATP synthase F1 subunit gamma [Flavobacteriales bacterium]MCX7650810.1 ATP synthase F1 subunit gamma [Flavobacteriales bacterium]MDW8431124.1 ATP synthase F1 subunit gamma [Flavobacteriales bacterium]